MLGTKRGDCVFSNTKETVSPERRKEFGLKRVDCKNEHDDGVEEGVDEVRDREDHLFRTSWFGLRLSKLFRVNLELGSANPCPWDSIRQKSLTARGTSSEPLSRRIGLIMPPHGRRRNASALLSLWLAVAGAILCLLPSALAYFEVGPFPAQDSSYVLPADSTVDSDPSLRAKALDAAGNVLSTSPSLIARCRAFDGASGPTNSSLGLFRPYSDPCLPPNPRCCSLCYD